MAGYYFLKLHHETLHDPKMGMLSDHLYRRVIEILLMASERQERDGYLPSVEVMAWTLHISVDDMQNDLEEIEKVSIVKHTDTGWYVTNFTKRQASTDPTAAERMQRYRERNESVTENIDDKDVTRNVTRNEAEKLRVELRIKNLESRGEGEEIKNKEATASTSLPTDGDILWYWTMATGMPALPSGNYERIMEQLYALHTVHRGELANYLKPFYAEWCTRNYSKSNTAWMDWAISGHIPERKTQPANGRNKGVEETLARLEARRKDVEG